MSVGIMVFCLRNWSVFLLLFVVISLNCWLKIVFNSVWIFGWFFIIKISGFWVLKLLGLVLVCMGLLFFDCEEFNEGVVFEIGWIGR